LRPRKAAALLGAATAALAGSSLALAQFTGTASGGPQAVSAATLAPPTGVTALELCVPNPTPSHSVEVAWVPSTSTFADAVEVTRSPTSGGPYVLLARLAATATSYADNATLASTAYYYVVRSAKLEWRTSSAQVAVTTKNNLCL
jgi:large repetitive protein